MMRIAVLLPIAALAAGCAAPADFDGRVRAALRGSDFSGAVVLGRGAEVFYAQAFGAADREAGRAFEVDTPADGASLAKTFTAAAVHLLVADGRLSLDDAVAQHVAEFPHPATRVRHLLTHSAGLPDYGRFDAALPPGTLRSTERLLGVLARERDAPAFTPGTRFEYSSFGYDVAALVVERASGMPFMTFVGTRLLAPLGLHAVHARPAFFADWSGPRTQGYRRRDGSWQRFDVFDGEAFVGGSNLYLSARDLARWAAAFADRAAALPQAARSAATATARLDDGRPLALSWGNWYCDEAALRCQYSGHLNAFHSVAYWDRDRGTTVAYVSNSTLDPWLTPRLTRDLVAAAAGTAPLPSDEAAIEPVAAAALARYAGRYEGAARGPLMLRIEGGQLRLVERHGVEYTAFRASRLAFYVPGLDVWLGFSAGPPTQLHIRSIQGDERAAQVAPAVPPAGDPS